MADLGNLTGARRNGTLGTFAICAVLAVGFGVLTAGVGMPRIPSEGVLVTVPATIDFTTKDGRHGTLHLSKVGRGPLAPDGSHAILLADDHQRVRGFLELDTVSHAHKTIRLASEHEIDLDGGSARSERGFARTDDTDRVAVTDIYVTYFEPEDAVLPSMEGPRGRRVAATGTDETLHVSDPTIRSISPEFTVRAQGEDVPAWGVEIDLAAAHALGRTNLPLSLGWYASPIGQALDTIAPWGFGIGSAGAVITGTVLLAAAARSRRDARAAGLTA